MSEAYLFRFGYCTPDQWLANETRGWDDESSGAFFVLAEDEPSALAWGRVVADAFVKREFELAGWSHPPGWRDAGFAAWIECRSEREMLQFLPRVRAGELPEFGGWQPS